MNFFAVLLALLCEQGVGILELDLGAEPVYWCNGLNGLQHQADKTVALALHTRHHGNPVHRDRLHLHPKGWCMAGLVRGLGGGNQ